MPAASNSTDVAMKSYRGLLWSLARGEDRALGEVLVIAAAVGKSVDDLQCDVDELVAKGATGVPAGPGASARRD